MHAQPRSKIFSATTRVTVHNLLLRSYSDLVSMSDSFADLWNTSAPLPAKPKPQTLTLAARLAEENDKRHRAALGAAVQSHKKTPDVSHEAWVGLDSLGSGIKVKVEDTDDWGLKDFGSSVDVAAPAPAAPAVANPDFDFDFGSREDMDQDLNIPAAAGTGTRGLQSSSVLNLLDDDDDHLMGGIGNRASDHKFLQAKGRFEEVRKGGTTVGLDDEDEEDILGVLSKPVGAVIAKKVLFCYIFIFLFSSSFFVFLWA